MAVSPRERELGIFLRDLPRHHNNRYSEGVETKLKARLFRSLAGDVDEYLPLLFPHGTPDEGEEWSLRDAQGAVDGAEYTEAAKGRPCGHIFKTGESTYHCKTCAADDTCVLCARCFAESDHEGHMVFITVSPGNSGCCDCADDEAWVRPVHCSIHSAHGMPEPKSAGKASVAPGLPDELVECIRMTIGKAFDYLCDVFSCSPEQLRLPKTEDSVKRDELLSRLTSELYGGPEVEESDEEYALILWNDEKHTVADVQNQVAKALKTTKSFGHQKAMEVNDNGRSIIHYSKDLPQILAMAGIIEQLKVSVTVRSSRDTFREQMCATIIDWISDISGCSVGSDPHVLRNTICQELLRPWRMGSEATNSGIGQAGIDDHEHEENVRERRANARWFRPMPNINIRIAELEDDDDDDDDDDDEDEDGDEDDEHEIDIGDEIMAEIEAQGEPMDEDFDQEAWEALAVDTEMELDVDPEGPGENGEATFAGYPPPPAPPAAHQQERHTRALTPAESEEGETRVATAPNLHPHRPFSELPKTPKHKVKPSRPPRPARFWLEAPEESKSQRAVSVEEDLWKRVRLDYLILYDLRLWKTLRVSLRHLYISTVVTVPQFKRILGLRFAGLYTLLAQLYLIADREPDHSIINLSVQMLTTPSITAEVVDRGNFLTNLMAILYTFLTTRQVGWPWEVNPNATLAFDAGAVTNRRMFHFFIDARYMFQSAFVQDKIRAAPRYLLQFLDLVKLHQGICPNVRAVGEHVEYEADAWISASMIIKEINRLCRQVAESFRDMGDNDLTPTQRAIRHTAQVTMLNAHGGEMARFPASEIKHPERFFDLKRKRRPQYGLANFETTVMTGSYSIPRFSVAEGNMSFHHPLHYLLSWLLEAGKGMDRSEMLRVLHFSLADQHDPWSTSKPSIHTTSAFEPDEIMCLLFEHPLRVVVWLAQMRAGMWVRNGITLRHQMHTYKGTSQRDVSYQRDLFMLQAGLVLCGNSKESLGERFLIQIIDRFDLSNWINGVYDLPHGFDEQQRLDVAEDFYHLLIVLLCERSHLVPGTDGSDQHLTAMQRDIAHVLCFKPLSFSDIANRLTDRIADAEEFDSVLEDMTTFRSPEGLNDSGTFELQSRYLDLIDPYYAYYNRNQREEAENIYKAHVGKKLGKPAADIVYEPKLPKITSGLFKHLSAFTQTTLFKDVIYWGLEYALKEHAEPESTQITRVETLLQVILHLTLLAVLEDATPEGPKPMHTEDSFIRLAISVSAYQTYPNPKNTILNQLTRLLDADKFSSCHAKATLIMHRMAQKWPEDFAKAKAQIAPAADRAASGSPASLSAEDKELKKKQALERQARVMAQFKAQQSSFMENQGLNWEDEDFSDVEEDVDMPESEKVPPHTAWQFPTGSCMLCQEETNEKHLYGTFAFMGPSRILRQTPVNDVDFVAEAVETPASLDRSADAIRPFGVANTGREAVQKTSADGSVVTQERSVLAKGFPCGETKEGPVTTSCGHLMHFSCFEAYVEATRRRHSTQIARNHPERPDSKEFLCPLCKALGNTFLPIIWKDKKYTFPAVMGTKKPEEAGLEIPSLPAWPIDPAYTPSPWHSVHMEYLLDSLNSNLSSNLPQLRPQAFDPGNDAESEGTSTPTPTERSLSPLFQDSRARAVLPELVQRAAIELGLTARQTPPEPRETRLPPHRELQLAWSRIESGLKSNGVIPSNSFLLESGTQTSAIQTAEALCNSLAFTISSVEISHRGVGTPENSAGSATFLDAIPEQAMTTLRILSETVSAVTADAATRRYAFPGADTRVHKSWHKQVDLLDGGVNKDDSQWSSLFTGRSLLETDLFVFLCNCTLNMVPMGDDVHDILRLCYAAELVKVLFTYLGRHSFQELTQDEPLRARMQAMAWPQESNIKDSFVAFQHWLASEDVQMPLPTTHRATTNTGIGVNVPAQAGWSNMTVDDADVPLLETIIDRYALAFLRKATLLVHIRCGVDFTAPGANPCKFNGELPEVARLAALLHLPLPRDMLAQFRHATPAGEAFRTTAANWILAATDNQAPLRTLSPAATSLSHPAIFELVGLPKHYDTLTEEAIKHRCPTTGREVTDPAICLFCGEIFCSQAGCCMRARNEGGCFQHRERCGGSIGIFIIIRKCMVLFLHKTHGGWIFAPYLDRHGEVDPALRRHHQLFLNQRRYDKLLRDAWLGHGVQSLISRRLEGDMNTGGWETL